MAIKRAVSFFSNQIVVDINYNQNDLEVFNIRVTNNTSKTIKITTKNNGDIYEKVGNGGGITVLVIPPGAITLREFEFDGETVLSLDQGVNCCSPGEAQSGIKPGSKR